MTKAASTCLFPTAREAELARESGRALAVCLQTNEEAQQIKLLDQKGKPHRVRIPVSVLKLLVEVLTKVGEGHSVSVVPIEAELTSQEAADLLNVSRPYLVQLLDSGSIPSHKIGTHRRVRYQDVARYKDDIDAERRKALDALAEQSQRLKTGYK